jgi:hypothetical protein
MNLEARILAYVANNPGRGANWTTLGTEYYEGSAAYAALRADGRLVDGFALSATGKKVRAAFVASDVGLSGLTRNDLDAIGAARRKAAR